MAQANYTAKTATACREVSEIVDLLVDEGYDPCDIDYECVYTLIARAKELEDALRLLLEFTAAGAKDSMEQIVQIQEVLSGQ